MNVKTNKGKRKENPLYKIFNKNMFKVSYNCMGNIASVISSRNQNFVNLGIAVEEAFRKSQKRISMANAEIAQNYLSIFCIYKIYI